MDSGVSAWLIAWIERKATSANEDLMFRKIRVMGKCWSSNAVLASLLSLAKVDYVASFLACSRL